MTHARNSSPVLATPSRKTSPPDRKGLVITRARLIGRLQDRDPRITLIQAPAGYGKTVLAMQWAASLGNPVAWVTLDDTDNDPVVQISTVMSAIERADPDSSWGDEPLTGDEPAYSRRVVPHFRIRLEAMRSPITVVIDDAHEVTESPAASLLVALLGSLPAGSRAIVAGRALGVLPVAQWLSEARAVMVTQDDLAMDPPEIATLLGELTGTAPLPHVAEELHDATGGWPIATYLGAGLDDLGDLGDLAHLDAFLEQQVLRDADAEIVRFLTLTSPLVDLSAAFCDDVLGERGSAGLLARAEASTLLITRSLDHGWYRLHPLLRDHLHRRLATEQPDLRRTILRRATQWSAESGYVDLAISYARESHDLDLVADMVWAGASDALQKGQNERVIGWLSALDEPVIATRRPLALTAAWAHIHRGNTEEAFRWAHEVLAAIPDPELPGPINSALDAGVAALLALRGAKGYREAAVLGTRTVSDLPPGNVIRPFAQLLSGWMQALAGDRDEGAENLRRAQQMARTRGLTGTEVEATALLATTLLSQNQAAQAGPLIRHCLESMDKSGLSNSVATRAVLIGPVAVFTARSGNRDLTRQRLAEAQALGTDFAQLLPWLPVVIGACAATAGALLGDMQEAGRFQGMADHAAAAIPASPLLDDLRASARTALEQALPLSRLSPAERRVWDLLQTRATLREVARTLSVSPETVKSQTGSIYRKLGISSRREAQELGDLIPPITDPGDTSTQPIRRLPIV